MIELYYVALYVTFTSAEKVNREQNSEPVMPEIELYR